MPQNFLCISLRKKSSSVYDCSMVYWSEEMIRTGVSCFGFEEMLYPVRKLSELEGSGSRTKGEVREILGKST